MPDKNGDPIPNPLRIGFAIKQVNWRLGQMAEDRHLAAEYI
jgi:hypothetical protein